VVGETGPQHAKQFEVKCIVYDPKTNVESECYKTGSTSISKAKQAVAEIALQNTKLEKPTAEQVKNKRIGKKNKKLNRSVEII
jgi:dsRNA-specific ribonuclease